MCYTGHLLREGKGTISREVAAISERLGTSAESWQARMQKLSEVRLLGRFLAASRQRLREVAERLGLCRGAEFGRLPRTVTAGRTLGIRSDRRDEADIPCDCRENNGPKPSAGARTGDLRATQPVGTIGSCHEAVKAD